MTKRQAGPVAPITETYDTIISGSLAVAGVAGVALGVKTRIFQVLVQNDSGSANSLFVGGAFAQTIEVTAGNNITIPANNLNIVFVRSVGATVNYLAMA